MDTIQITNERLNLFVLCAKNFVTTTPRSVLWFAVDKILKKALKLLKKCNDDKEKQRRKYAVRNDKGIYELTEKGGWRWTEQGYELCDAELKKIDDQLIDLPIHIVKQYDESILTFDMRNNFEGIVIPAIDYETFDIDGYKSPEKELQAK